MFSQYLKNESWYILIPEAIVVFVYFKMSQRAKLSNISISYIVIDKTSDKDTMGQKNNMAARKREVSTQNSNIIRGAQCLRIGED